MAIKVQIEVYGMCAAKVGVSKSSLSEAIFGGRAAAASGAKPAPKKATGKASAKASTPKAPASKPSKASPLKLSIKDPEYTPEQLEEILASPKKSTTVRAPGMLKAMLMRPLILNNPSDPELLKLDNASMIRLALFAMNGVEDSLLKECIELHDNVPSNSTAIFMKVSSSFERDFVDATLSPRIANLTKKSTGRNFSTIIRIAIVFIGRLSDMGILDETLKSAKKLQYEYGLDLVNT